MLVNEGPIFCLFLFLFLLLGSQYRNAKERVRNQNKSIWSLRQTDAIPLLIQLSEGETRLSDTAPDVYPLIHTACLSGSRS